MKKYLAIIRSELKRLMTYRASVFAFSVGDIFELLIQVAIWTAAFKSVAVIGGYSYSEMMTYVVIGWLFSFITATYGFDNVIAKEIHEGSLSNLIIKPISYLRYITAVSFGRLFLSSMGRIIILLMLFFLLLIFGITTPLIHHTISLNFANLVILFFMLVVTYFLKLFITILTGFIAFWTMEITGIYFSINVVTKLFSGKYFPINILPAGFVTVSLFFPFIYTFYIPAQLFLGKISKLEGLRGLGIEIIWMLILYALVKVVWHRGLKRYEGVGI
jgi:ABC-2 type transport system permease protein